MRFAGAARSGPSLRAIGGLAFRSAIARLETGRVWLQILNVGH